MLISRTQLARAFCATILLFAPFASSGGAVVPLAPIPEEAPFTRQYHSQQFRMHEAESKARGLAKMLDESPNKTANMSLYDVVAYDLVLDLNPQQQLLTGTTQVRAAVLGTSLTQVELHLLNNMTVTAVRSNGSASSFTHINNILAISLDRTYDPGQEFVVEVDYGGDPSGDYFGWGYYDGAPLIWSLSEPYGARHWWPCKDLNTDKADAVDLHVTVPEIFLVASNGLLDSVTIPEPGKHTFHWQERYPIATYLVSLAIHPYATFSDTYTGLSGQQMPLEYYVVPSSLAQAQASFPVTVDMLEAFAPAFGEYPFINEKYGHAHFPWGGGMEHQTLTSLYHSIFSEGIIAHELGHQWWGDMITCADFGHIWLNEGFATWSEAYWREVNEGMAAYHEEMALARYTGGGTIFVEDPSNFFSIFEYNLSYQKASWVPHMLRGVLGDDDFFAGLAHYRELYEGGSATTEQFRDAMEAVSGQDLDAFFQQWIYTPFFPRYQYNYAFSSQPEGMRLDLKITQVQTNTGLFSMPVDVRVYSQGGSYQDFEVFCDQQEQWYALDVPGDAIFITLDPENWILCETIPGGAAEATDLPEPVSKLLGNYPNPFNPATSIRYLLADPGTVFLDLYDVSGRRIISLVEGWKDAGHHEIRWNGVDQTGQPVPSGVYFVRMSAGGTESKHKIMLVQ